MVGRIISRLVALRKRALYDSSLGAVSSMASVVAPLLGGVLTSRLSWRWCFWINLPSGFVAAVAILLLVNLDQGHSMHRLPIREKAKHFDFPGALALSGSIVSLLLSLQWAGTKYTWNSPTIIALCIVASVLAALFAFMQWRAKEHALVPLQILKRRSIWCSLSYITIGGAAVTIAEYYVRSQSKNFGIDETTR